jgi:hypothetical protein
VAVEAVATADPHADSDVVERQALARFELERDPDGTDGQIGAALGIGVAAIRTQRRNLRNAGQLAAVGLSLDRTDQPRHAQPRP